MLELKNVVLKTRHMILNDESFSFENGKIYGVVAVNGSGKTTLFRAITHLIPLSAGSIEMDSNLSTFYYETSEWFDGYLSGMDYLKFVKNMWKSDHDINKEIEYWDMGEYINVPVRKYSLGMKQRLLISMYFVSRADVMLMDEITSGLDEENRKKFFKRIDELDKSNKVIIISSHYKEDLEDACDVIIGIQDQKLVVI